MTVLREGTGARWLLTGAAAAVVVDIASLIWLAGGLRAQADSGGHFQLDFIAAAPLTHNRGAQAECAI